MSARYEAEGVRLLPPDGSKGRWSCFEVWDRGQEQDSSREAHSIRANVRWEDL